MQVLDSKDWQNRNLRVVNKVRIDKMEEGEFGYIVASMMWKFNKEITPEGLL